MPFPSVYFFPSVPVGLTVLTNVSVSAMAGSRVVAVYVMLTRHVYRQRYRQALDPICAKLRRTEPFIPLCPRGQGGENETTCDAAGSLSGGVGIE